MNVDLIFMNVCKINMAKLNYINPNTDYIQSYNDWVDDGYDYDLISAGLLPIYPKSHTQKV